MKLFITAEKLTDQSETFNVVLNDDGDIVQFLACSEKDAIEMEDKLRSAIRLHSINEID